MELMNRNFELEEAQKLEGHTDRVWSVAWNPVTHHEDDVLLILASCSGDKTVRIWEQSSLSHTWTCKAVLEDTHTKIVRSCACSPSRKILATGHESELRTISWNASGSLLGWDSENEFDCSYDNTIKIWWCEDEYDDYHCVQILAECNNDDLTMKIWKTDIARMHSGEGYVPCDDIIASGAGDNAIGLFVDSKVDSVDEPSYKLLLKKENAHEMDEGSPLFALASDDRMVKIWH